MPCLCRGGLVDLQSIDRMTEGKQNPPSGLNMGSDEALKRFAQTEPKELTESPRTISRLASKPASKELTLKQPSLALSIEKDTDVGGIGMGVLSDGTPYLSQRGLAAVCGVMNTHLGTISSQWTELEEKPRIRAIKSILGKVGPQPQSPHIEVTHKGTVNFCYPAEVSLAIMEYYAFDAGANCRPEARENFRLLAGSKLRELIYNQTGYDPSGKNTDRLEKWHDRISLNYQSAPKGFFHVFNEANTIIYELIRAGAVIGDKFVVESSIGQHWAAYWWNHSLNSTFGERARYSHYYPADHPQSRSNPQDSWYYPLASLGKFRVWLQDEYLEGGKFADYLARKEAKGEIPPSLAQLAVATLAPAQIQGPT